MNVAAKRGNDFGKYELGRKILGTHASLIDKAGFHFVSPHFWNDRNVEFPFIISKRVNRIVIIVQIPIMQCSFEFFAFHFGYNKSMRI